MLAQIADLRRCAPFMSYDRNTVSKWKKNFFSVIHF